MNLHKEITRRKMILALIVAGVLLVAACYVVGSRRGLTDIPSVPTTVVDPDFADDPTVSVADTIPTMPPVSQDGTQQTTTAGAQSTTTTAPPHSPVVVLPPDYMPERAECSGRFTVTSESANVRTDADKDAAMVRKIYAGETYDVIAQKPSPGDILWFELQFGDGTTGYVSASYGTYDGKIVNGKVYLTFDDGPSANTLRILDTLDKYGVKATFFVIYHPNQENTYRSIVERGHVIAMHSYTHNYSQIYSSEDAFHRDIKQLSDYVYDVTGVRSDVLRFPGGSSNTISKKHCPGIMSSLTRSVADRGYTYYDWDVDSGDADGNTMPKEYILNNIKTRMSNRRDAIILMHDASAKTTTADALPEIIEYLQGKGYRILPITPDTHTSHQEVNN